MTPAKTKTKRRTPPKGRKKAAKKRRPIEIDEEMGILEDIARSPASAVARIQALDRLRELRGEDDETERGNDAGEDDSEGFDALDEVEDEITRRRRAKKAG